MYCACEFLKYFVTGAKDLSIFGTNISLLNKFLKHFASCFSKKQLAMFTLLVYALFKDYKRNSLDAMANATHKIIRNYSISSQIPSGTYKPSNKNG